MYEAVYAHPDGDSTVARHALTAADSEYDGIVVRNHGDEQADYDADAISDAYGVDVAAGIEVRADDPSRASGFVGNYRSDRTVVVVHGGDRRINRFAVEQPTVDVLAHPMRDDGDFNHVLANAAADNGVRVEFDFGPVLGPPAAVASGPSRNSGSSGNWSRTLARPSSSRRRRALISRFEHRRSHPAGRPSASTLTPSARALTECGQIVERNRERQSGAVIEPGVRLEDDADDAE